MTIKEFAKQLRISIPTISRLIRNNLIKSHKERGHRIIDQTVEEYLQQYETKSQF